MQVGISLVGVSRVEAGKGEGGDSGGGDVVQGYLGGPGGAADPKKAALGMALILLSQVSGAGHRGGQQTRGVYLPHCSGQCAAVC